MESSKKKKLNIAFWGSAKIAVPLFCALERHQEISIKCAVTQPDKKANKNILTESPIKREAKSLGIPVLQPTSLSDKNFYQTFLDADISLCVLFAYGSIIPALLLDTPPLGWVNVHPSLLPAYRGASPIQWAIKNNDSLTGISLIQMDDGIDTGPLIAQWKLFIEKSETYETVSKKIALEASQRIPETIVALANGKIEPHDQSEEGKSTTRRLKKEDGNINWRKSAEEIERQIRAYNPWPGTHSIFLGERIKILSSKVLPHASCTNETPGTTRLRGNNLIVCCGQNTGLQILSMQRAGKKIQAAEEFIRGFPVIAHGQFDL